MVSNTSLWRPKLFASVGVGFKDDPHLVDGLHFRWHIAHHFGLPFQSKDEKRGVFRLYHRRGRPHTIESLQQLNPTSGGPLPVYDEAALNPNSGVIPGANSLSFWKRPATDVAFLFMRLRGILDSNPSSLWAWRETEEDQVLRRYVTEVTARLGPDFLPNTMLRERTDACAVDVGFTGIGTGSPSPDGRRFVIVDGLDRGGRVVDQDWVGQEPSGTPRTVARLRGAGFASVRWTRVSGQPPVTRTPARWILSEEYCHSEGWVEEAEYRFVADPDFHTPPVAKDHYAPFRAPFDPDQVADAIGNLLLSTPEIKKLFEPGQDVYQMATRAAAFAEASDSEAGEVRASLLQSLIASGVDPVMARILGLYAFVTAADAADKRGGDVLIEAELSFFEPFNLEAIDERLHALLPEQEKFFFRNLAGSLDNQRLCALIIAPSIAKRQPLPKPDVVSTSITAAALPSQGPNAETQIFVQARLEVQVDPLEARPELTPVAYHVERQISGGGFVNISESLGEPDILDKIGLLPGVYFPARTDTTGQEPLRVADDFTLPDLQPASVVYRVGAFDVFGRPSDPVEGDKQNIEPPYLPPPPPLNPAARIVVEAGNLMLEVDFAVNSATPPLEADWQRLEISIHRLPPLDPITPDPRPAGEVTWPGQIAARRLAANVMPGNVLNPALGLSCVNLAWTPGITATDTLEAACAVFYPAPAPQLIAVDPPSSPLAETGLRSYRLRVTVGPETGMPPAPYRWCARFVIIGRNPINGNRLDSAEVSVAADWMIHPPPPAVVAPITSIVPLSSYPDVHGESWYDLDLGAWGLAAGDRVSIYMTRLRRLGDTAGDLVVDGVLQDQLLFEQMARASRKPFELATREPVEFSPAAPFHRIKVPGHLREVYVLAILGSNAYLQERRWAEAGFTLFMTPDRRPEPRVGLVRLTRPGAAVARLEFAADFADVPGAATPPKVQLFRRDLSAGARLAYVGDATGASMRVEPGSDAAARFSFTVDDTGQDDWRAYEYEAQLLHHDSGLGTYLRSRAVARALARAAWDGVAAPVTDADAIEVSAGSPTGLVLGFEFDSGEFDFTLVRSLGGIVSSRFAGRIRAGRMFGLDPAIHTLSLVRRDGRTRYRLTIRDLEAVPVPVPAGPDAPQDGTYILRIAFGEEVAWTVRENVEA